MCRGSALIMDIHLQGKTKFVGKYFLHWTKIDSTNEEAGRRLRSDHLPDGAVLSADFQTAGKGQHHHVWLSEPGANLLFTVVFHQRIAIAHQHLWNMAISVACADFMKDLGVGEAALKWPNDLVVAGGKVGGILITNQVRSAQEWASVVGIGINLNQMFPPEPRMTFPPLSVKQITGRHVDRDEALTRLLLLLEEAALAFRAGRFQSILESYQAHLYARNLNAAFEGPQGTFVARLLGVNENGEAVVEMPLEGVEKRLTHPTFRFMGIPE